MAGRLTGVLYIYIIYIYIIYTLPMLLRRLSGKESACSAGDAGDSG